MDVADLVDTSTGRQSRSIYSSEPVYRQELERVFGRCWLFLAHTSQIPQPNDFFRTYMGEDDVIVIRQKDGSVKAFLNTCTHRGNRICRADRGNARSFTCNYHGWSFAPDGALAGVPLENEAYFGELDRSKFGLALLWHKCQSASKRDPRSARKRDPLSSMARRSRNAPCAARGVGRAEPDR
ncbi:Rieske 2Fe-2S domain-containing protein, partial [Sphingobium olei]